MSSLMGSTSLSRACADDKRGELALSRYTRLLEDVFALLVLLGRFVRPVLRELSSVDEPLPSLRYAHTSTPARSCTMRGRQARGRSIT
jgi:hypothetical protein